MVRYVRFLSLDISLISFVIYAPAARFEISRPRFDLRFWRVSLPRSSHTTDLKIGTPVATLPGVWRYRVSAGAGLPGVSIL